MGALCTLLGPPGLVRDISASRTSRACSTGRASSNSGTLSTFLSFLSFTQLLRGAERCPAAKKNWYQNPQLPTPLRRVLAEIAFDLISIRSHIGWQISGRTIKIIVSSNIERALSLSPVCPSRHDIHNPNYWQVSISQFALGLPTLLQWSHTWPKGSSFNQTSLSRLIFVSHPSHWKYEMWLSTALLQCVK